jgi:hypothetical protein
MGAWRYLFYMEHGDVFFGMPLAQTWLARTLFYVTDTIDVTN